MLNHQHVYSTLRSALVDRENDPSFIVDNAVIVNISGNQFALKNSVPSGALLVAYSMLFRPRFAELASGKDSKWFANGHYWLGGDSNTGFPLFINDTVASIAIAVGVYAGIIDTVVIEGGVHLRPNFNTPMVQRTVHEIVLNKLTLLDAKDLFINLMQDEQYRLTVPVADDFIANPFIAEFGVGIDSTLDEAREASREISE